MSKATTPSKDFVRELLKKIQNGITEIRNGQTDMRRDIRGMKDELVSLRTIMGEFMKTDARRESDHLNLAGRVRRIEQHLDLPPV